MPLLEKIIQEEEEEEEEEPKKGKKDKPKKEKGAKGKKGQNNPYAAPDEYEAEKQAKVKNYSLKTQRVNYAKIIEFPEEALVIESPEGNLEAIRDTLRSCVEVKLIYLKWKPPEKVKKGKGPKDKKSAKGSKGKSKGKSEGTLTPKKEKPPTETIIKKVTLGAFTCCLRNVNWSDKSIDFHWAKYPDVVFGEYVKGDLRVGFI